MKKLLSIFGFILLAVIVYSVIAMLAFDKNYHIEKSMTINAPVQNVWNNMNSLRAYNTWDPFSKADKTVEIKYSGKSGEVGDSYHWTGKEAGEGTQTVKEIVPNDRMVTDLHFIKPFESDAVSIFKLNPEGNATKVTWTMEYEMTPMMKPLKPVMDVQMDKSFAQGLKNLKALSEN